MMSIIVSTGRTSITTPTGRTGIVDENLVLVPTLVLFRYDTSKWTAFGREQVQQLDPYLYVLDVAPVLLLSISALSSFLDL